MPKDVIAILAYDRISAFMLATPIEVFQSVAGLPNAPELRVCAVEPGPLRAMGGMVLSPDYGPDGVKGAGLVILPGWRGMNDPAPPALLALLRAAHADGAMIVGLCLGAFVLAEAGLLAGRRATTHWLGADVFAQRFPDVTLDAAAIYVDEGDVVTSAGVAAGIDCCLHLVANRFGARMAGQSARRMVMPPQRSGGQAQYIERPMPSTASDRRFVAMLQAAVAQPEAVGDIDMMAARLGMSRRSFIRHFRAQTGMSFGAWLRSVRLGRARELLEHGLLSVEDVATQCGFGTALSFREAFRRETGLSPTDWRRNFRRVDRGA